MNQKVRSLIKLLALKIVISRIKCSDVRPVLGWFVLAHLEHQVGWVSRRTRQLLHAVIKQVFLHNR